MSTYKKFMLAAAVIVCLQLLVIIVLLLPSGTASPELRITAPEVTPPTPVAAAPAQKLVKRPSAMERLEAMSRTKPAAFSIPKITVEAQTKQKIFQQTWDLMSVNNRYFPEGTSKKEIYVFYDYNCGGCKAFKKTIAPFIADNLITVNWVPLSILPGSMDKAAVTLLPNKEGDRLRLFKVLSDSNKVATDLLNPMPTKEEMITGKTYAGHNLATLALLGTIATPTVFYNTVDGFESKPIMSKIGIERMIEAAI